MKDKKAKFQPRPAAQSAPPRSMAEAFNDAEEPITMFTLRMNRDLHRRLKIQAVNEGRPMKDILEALLRNYLDSKQA